MRELTKRIIVNFFMPVGIFFLLVCAAEFSFRALYRPASTPSIQPMNEDQLLKAQGENRSKLFCDFIHKMRSGKEVMAACVRDALGPSFFADKKSVWAFGASTTERGECGDPVSWVDLLKPVSAKTQIEVFALGGESSDHSIGELESMLSRGVKPDAIIWNDWGANEFMFYGDGRDRNHIALKAKFPKLPSRYGWKENLSIFALRLEKTLSKYSKAYAFLKTRTSNGYSSQSDLDHWVSYLRSKTLESELVERDRQVVFGGFLGGALRDFFSKDNIEYALENYRINMMRLRELSEASKIPVVCVNHPHLDGYYKHAIPGLSAHLDQYLSSVLSEMKRSCKDFEFIDVIPCFSSSVKN